MIAELVQVPHYLSATQFRMEQFAIEKEPRAAHEPWNGRSTGIVDQKGCFNSFHHQSGQLDASGAYFR